MVDKGFWIVRSSPATAALSSSLDPFLWEYGSPSIELRGVISDPLAVDLSGTVGDNCAAASASLLRSAIADTAASTFLSNSSSLTVKLVRSSVSMNWIAPDYANALDPASYII